MELHCAEIVIGSGTLKMAGNVLFPHQPFAYTSLAVQIGAINNC